MEKMLLCESMGGLRHWHYKWPPRLVISDVLLMTDEFNEFSTFTL